LNPDVYAVNRLTSSHTDLRVNRAAPVLSCKIATLKTCKHGKEVSFVNFSSEC